MKFEVNIDSIEVESFFKKSPARMRWANSEALKMTGGHIRGKMRRFIEKGGRGWKPLSPLTGKKGRTYKTPLHFLGRLIRFKYGTSKGVQSVRIGFFPTREKVKKINLGAGDKYTQLYNVNSVKRVRNRFKRDFKMSHLAFARLHEYGKSFNARRAKGAFASRGTPLKKSTTKLKIPARPFVRPVWQMLKGKLPRYYKRRLFQKFFSKQKPSIKF